MIFSKRMIKYFVFDTNTLISAFLLIDSINRKAIIRAILDGEIAFSSETLNEFKEVIFRKKLVHKSLKSLTSFPAIKTCCNYILFVEFPSSMQQRFDNGILDRKSTR